MRDRLPVAISIIALVIALAALLSRVPSTGLAVPKTEKVTIEQSSGIIQAVKKVSPAVVAITSKSQVTNLFGFTQAVEGAGSGFVITADGLIVTNRHVVADENALYTVVTSDGKKFQATVVARDPVLDLAVVKIEATNLPVVDLGDSEKLQIGEPVVAIGNALGQFQNTVTSGVLSGVQRNLDNQPDLEGLLQTDAAINPGNSGGPLVNIKGQVIGINTVKSSGEGLSFAIPINPVKKVIDSVEKTGKISRPYLGLKYVILDRKVSALNDLPVDYGAYVQEVVKNGPAERAGIKQNDIVLEFENTKIDTDHQLATLIADKNVGDKVNLKVRRGDKELAIQATLEEFKN